MSKIAFLNLNVFYMLQLGSVKPLRPNHIKQGCGLALRPLVIGKDHWQMLIKSANSRCISVEVL